jgi:membrane associated rhomboid family serine protease
MAETPAGMRVSRASYFFLGFWFLYQLFEANVGVFSSSANGGGVAFFAHVGGFIFGAIVAWTLVGAGLVVRPDGNPPLRTPAGAL